MNVPIKIGEQVTIKDGSYMIAIDIRKNELTRWPVMDGFNGNLVKYNHTYTVIAINVNCPTEKSLTNSLSIANNCIIKDNENNVIWFCSKINLKTVRNLK